MHMFLNHASLAAMFGSIALALAACGDSSATSGSSSSETSTGDTGTGGYMDQVPCDPVECTSGEDCCSTDPASTNYVGLECDNMALHYALRWSCVSSKCVQAGCDSDTDCATSGLDATWACHDIDSIGFCIQPCTSDAQCTDIFMSKGTTCSGVTDDVNVSYCAEP